MDVCKGKIEYESSRMACNISKKHEVLQQIDQSKLDLVLDTVGIWILWVKMCSIKVSGFKNTLMI